jgi:ribosomal protein S18 acetylase RimI-like enzyme
VLINNKRFNTGEMSKKIELHKSTSEDAKAIVELALQNKELQINRNDPFWYSEEELAKALLDDSFCAFSAFVDGEFAGFGTDIYHSCFAEGYLSDLAVKPEFRGLGISKLLYDVRMSWLKAKKVVCVWAMVDEDNELMKGIMAKRGFTQGKKFFFYYTGVDS